MDFGNTIDNRADCGVTVVLVTRYSGLFSMTIKDEPCTTCDCGMRPPPVSRIRMSGVEVDEEEEEWRVCGDTERCGVTDSSVDVTEWR